MEVFQTPGSRQMGGDSLHDLKWRLTALNYCPRLLVSNKKTRPNRENVCSIFDASPELNKNTGSVMTFQAHNMASNKKCATHTSHGN